MHKSFEKIVKFNESMQKHTSLEVGGPAFMYAVPDSIETLKSIIRYAQEKELFYMIIGRGTNLLVKDNGIKGIVIDLTKHFDKIKIKKKNIIKAGAGAGLQALCRFAIESGLGGINFTSGIPGSVGGAIMMNAGAFGREIRAILESVTVLTKDLKTLKISKNQIEFSYRNIKIQGIKEPILLEGEFALYKADPDALKKERKEILTQKNRVQPVKDKSAGCFFKNPKTGKTAGQLIEMAGLKGKQIKGAAVSEKHGNFIVNTGNAKAEDILSLKKIIQERVMEKFGVKLTPEVKIVGQ